MRKSQKLFKKFSIAFLLCSIFIIPFTSQILPSYHYDINVLGEEPPGLDQYQH